MTAPELLRPAFEDVQFLIEALRRTLITESPFWRSNHGCDSPISSKTPQLDCPHEPTRSDMGLE
jgi:hypothetical protein